MSVEQGKTILEIIQSRLIPDEQAKKDRGEVFTPLPLVREILYGLRKEPLEKGIKEIWGVDANDNPIEDNSQRVGGVPLDLWTNPESKWLDPANGIGNFPYIAFQMLDFKLSKIKSYEDKTLRRKHIVEKMLFMIEIDKGNVNTSFKIFEELSPGSKPNICCADTLQLKDETLNSRFGINRFDIIMGNPPFNAPRKLPGQTNILWDKFLEWSYKISRIVMFVLPSTFIMNKRDKKKIDILKQNGLYIIRYIKENEFPGIGLGIVYIATDKNNKERNILINNRFSISYDDTISDYESNDESERNIFKKIKPLTKLTYFKGKNFTLNYNNPVETDNIKFKFDDEHPHKMLSRLGGGDIQYYWVKEFKEEPIKEPKIVFPIGTASYGDYNRIIDLSRDLVFSLNVKGNEILSRSLAYVPVEKEEFFEAYKFYILRSKFVRFIFLKKNLGAEQLSSNLFDHIPKISPEKMTSDELIYDAIGLDDDEKQYIETLFASAIKKTKKKSKGGIRLTKRRKLETTSKKTRRFRSK